MSERYTISQLAHAADVPSTTVRYYERIGLVQPEDRLAEIDQRLKDLRQVQRVLKDSLAKCKTSNPRRACHVLESLT